MEKVKSDLVSIRIGGKAAPKGAASSFSEDSIAKNLMKASPIISATALSLLVSATTVWSANSALPQASISVAEQAKVKQAEADLKSLSVALAMFKLNAGVYPTAEQGLKSLVEKPDTAPVPRRWARIMDKTPTDPWGNDYRYVTRKENDKIVHVIISDGPDSVDASDNIELVLEAGKK